MPENAGEQTREQLGFLFAGMIYQLGDTLLRLRPAVDDAFGENRVGLDRLSFAVENSDVLDDAARQLDSRGIQHAGVRNIGMAYILEFRDPDTIALELFAPRA